MLFKNEIQRLKASNSCSI